MQQLRVHVHIDQIMAKPKKKRIPVPRNTDADVLFLSNHTCCVCREPGRPVQIHHIDDDPSNNSIDNLAVLCLFCHNDTQVVGGFGKKLKDLEVIKYRDDWIARVENRRSEADRLAIQAMSLPSKGEERSDGNLDLSELSGPEDLIAYVQRTPVILKAAYLAANPLMGGSTADMVTGMYEIIDVVVQILVRLSEWYPENHFGDGPAEEYFSKYVSDRAIWCRAIVEPEGYGNGGTIKRISAASMLVSEMEHAVESIVFALFEDHTGENLDALNAWASEWNGARGFLPG